MKKSSIILFCIIINYCSFKAQIIDCGFERRYSNCFNQFINFNDTVKYSLDCNFDKICKLDSINLILFLIDKKNDKGQFGNRIPPKVINSMLALNTSFTKPALGFDSTYRNTMPSDSLSLSYYSGRVNRPFIMPSKLISSKELFIYFIYSLYEGSFEFINVIRLTDKKSTVNIEAYTNKSNIITYSIVNERILKKGLKSMRKWKSLVNKKGLKYVRDNKITPLHYSNLEWGK